jgi:hypothetical protein
MYNIDETSLMIKNYYRPAMVSKIGMCAATYSPPEPIFSCTAVFVVSADGGASESTLLLNSKANMSALNEFARRGVTVRYARI